jgi:hypothetical protein
MIPNLFNKKIERFNSFAIETIRNSERSISFSLLSSLKRNIKEFNNYINKTQKETDSLIFGKLFHCLILTPSSLETQFLIGKNPYTMEEQEELLKMFKEKHFDFNIFVEEEKEMLSENDDEELYYSRVSYAWFEYNKFLNRKIELSKVTIAKINYVNRIIYRLCDESKILNSLIANRYNKKTNSFNEFELESKLVVKSNLGEEAFKIKGIIDKLTIKDNEVKITEIKTKKIGFGSSKFFPDNWENYYYRMQYALYYLLVCEYLTSLGEEVSKYTFKFELIVINYNTTISSNLDDNYIEPYLIPFSEIEKGLKDLDESLNLFAEHLQYGFRFPLWEHKEGYKEFPLI